MTEDGTITLDEQRKALEYLLSPAQQKEPPRLERIYDFTLARKAYQELQARGWKPIAQSTDRQFALAAQPIGSRNNMTRHDIDEPRTRAVRRNKPNSSKIGISERQPNQLADLDLAQSCWAVAKKGGFKTRPYDPEIFCVLCVLCGQSFRIRLLLSQRFNGLNVWNDWNGFSSLRRIEVKKLHGVAGEHRLLFIFRHAGELLVG